METNIRNKCKAYTSLEQSKKLAEILPLESADCYWDYDEMQKFHRISWFEDGYNKESQLRFNENNICAWSLAALLSVIPNPSLHKTFSGWRCDSYNKEGTSCILGESTDNPIDSCYEMILKLHELKML